MRKFFEKHIADVTRDDMQVTYTKHDANQFAIWEISTCITQNSQKKDSSGHNFTAAEAIKDV